jgi:hypothetical protein
MKLNFVDTMDDVLKYALEQPLPEVPAETPGIAALDATQNAPAAHQ